MLLLLLGVMLVAISDDLGDGGSGSAGDHDGDILISRIWVFVLSA